MRPRIGIWVLLAAVLGGAVLFGSRGTSGPMDDLGLRSITLSSGRLSPRVSSATVNYTIAARSVANPVTIRVDTNDETSSVSVNGKPVPTGGSLELEALGEGSRILVEVANVAGAKRTYSILVLPDDFPGFDVKAMNDPQPGYIFLGNYEAATMDDPEYSAVGRYLIILDENVTPVWYYKSKSPKGDFGVQPNGALSFFEWYSKTYYTIDADTKDIIRSYSALGYPVTDSHDFIINPDGSYFIGAKVDRVEDLSAIGGHPEANVVEFVIQKASAADEILWEWRSWEHLSPDMGGPDQGYTEPPPAKIDYAHFNSMVLDGGGNFVIGNKHMSQIMKIDMNTGETLWRLGGKGSDFTFEGDPLGHFNHQHCVRLVPNGNVLMYDNGKLHDPPQSRAVEYQLDFTRKVAKMVFSFSYPDMYTEVMGSVQKLANGSTFIGWGGPKSDVTFTEVKNDGSIATEVSLTPPGQVSYRIQKFQWNPPWLASK
jgi:hypothetical protein